MGLYESSNPIISFVKKVSNTGDGLMTIEGVKKKTFALLLLTLLTSAPSYLLIQSMTTIAIVGLGCATIGFLTALVAMKKPKYARLLAPIYALLQGVVFGVISRLVDLKYPGASIQAAIGTIAVFIAMLAFYKVGHVRLSDRAREILYSCVSAYSLLLCLDILASVFMPGSGWPSLNDATPFMTVVNIGVIIMAAICFIDSFQSIEECVEAKASKEVEWIAALGMLANLLWMYLELLRLIEKLRK